MLYKCVLTLDGITQPVEIMDTSASCEESSDEHLQWADAFVVVYSITDKDSYDWAANTVQVITYTFQIIILPSESDFIVFPSCFRGYSCDLSFAWTSGDVL